MPKLKRAVLALLLTSAAFGAESLEPAASVTAKKGPVQITLSVYGTQVKLKKSIWYRIELKNIGKKPIKVEDKIFRDPWAMHENAISKSGLYIEGTGAGEPLDVRSGGGAVTWDYRSQEMTKKDSMEFEAARQEWKRKGLTPKQQAEAKRQWERDWTARLQFNEDSAKEVWLKPGASIRTFPWANRDQPGKFNPEFDEPQVPGFTQLWSYWLFTRGKYKIRAVYDHQVDSELAAVMRRSGMKVEPWAVRLETPYVEIEAVP